MRTTVIMLLLFAAACTASPEPLQHTEFPQLCDAKAQLIRSTCERDARCGAITTGEVDACTIFIATYFGWSGCGFIPAFGDDTYRTCFNAMSDMDCTDLTAEPTQCTGIFIADPTHLADSAPEQP